MKRSATPLAATLLVCAVAASAAHAAGAGVLAGTWVGRVEGQEVTLELRGDGTCTLSGADCAWSAAGGALRIDEEQLRYRLDGERLLLTDAAGQTVSWARSGARSAAAPASPSVTREPTAAARKLRINGRSLSARQRQTLQRLERAAGRLADRDYWYDPVSGASGLWGGPALALLPAGLDLGGAVPAEASGGGRGNVTGVFVNGRELHPLDLAALQAMVGQVLPGRWWVDAQGNYGIEAGPALGNLYAAARARRGAGRGGGSGWSKRYEGVANDNMGLAGDGTTTCVSTAGYSRCTGE